MHIRFLRARPLRWGVVVAVALLVAGSAIALVDQVGGGGESESRDVSTGGEASGAPSVPPVDSTTSSDGTDQLGGQSLPSRTGERIVKEASLALTVARQGIGPAYSRAVAAVSQEDGWVDSAEVADEQASLVLKVPAPQLESALIRLRELGDVEHESVSSSDVTQEYVDLEARLRHWRAQETVFLGLMAKATTVAETIQVQTQLSTVQEQIEQLEGRRRLLEDRTSWSTIRLVLATPGASAGTSPPTTLARAWDRALGAALAVIGGALVVLGAGLPLAGLLLVALGLRLIIVHRRRPNRPGPGMPAAAESS